MEVFQLPGFADHRLGWHKPGIQCLVIHLDTQSAIDLGPDAAGEDFSVDLETVEMSRS
jgi:hypothetical protein